MFINLEIYTDEIEKTDHIGPGKTESPQAKEICCSHFSTETMRLGSANEGAAGTFLEIWKPREPIFFLN